MKLRLSHCSIRRSLKTVQRLHLCGSGVHSPCDPRHMNPPELAGWPGTHSPCSPRPSRQVISSADGTSWRPIRRLSPSLERQTRRWQATDPGPSPELGKADTRSGEGPGSIACATAPEQVLAEPRESHGACSLHRTRVDGSMPVAIAVPHSTPDPVARCVHRADFRLGGKRCRCRHLQATDPGPSPERVSAFPSSGEGPGSTACNQRVSAFPGSGEGPGSVACRARPTSSAPPHPAATGRATDSTAESARAGTPSGRPARAGPSGRCTPRSWA